MISDSDYILELTVVSFIYMFIFSLRSEVKLFNYRGEIYSFSYATLPIFYCGHLHSILGRS